MASAGIVVDVYAACAGRECKDVMIERLYVRADDAIQVSTNSRETDLNCFPSEGMYLTLKRGHPARYTHRVAISNRWLVALDADHVTFDTRTTAATGRSDTGP